MALMNLAIHGIEQTLEVTMQILFTKICIHKLKADYILANPPFNLSDWNDGLLMTIRAEIWSATSGNANFAWLQHMIHHLSPNGKSVWSLQTDRFHLAAVVRVISVGEFRR